MDLSKAFDTINHELLIAKLDAYGFEESALEIINSYCSKYYYYFPWAQWCVVLREKVRACHIFFPCYFSYLPESR